MDGQTNYTSQSSTTAVLYFDAVLRVARVRLGFIGMLSV